MRILAIDAGDKKIGLAIGDTATRMAFARPALLVDSWADVWRPLTALLRDENIEQVIIGWPLNADASRGAQSGRIQEFIEQLKKHSTVPVIKRDERHTSAAVQREQQTVGRRLKRGQEDSLAAQLLLETYFMENNE